MLNNLRYAARRFPDRISFDSGEAMPLVARNAVPTALLRSGRFLYMPQNAWPWHGPYGRPREATRKLTLRAVSELALRRAVGTIRISGAIPDPGQSVLPTLHNVLDDGFESNLEAASCIETGLSDAVLCVGSIGTYRNVERLICAFDRYHKTNRGTRLLLQGPVARSLKGTIGGMSARRPYVTLNAGSMERAHVLAAFRDCRLAVFPSLVEASSVTLLEALALGTRVIASDIPGHVGVAGDQVKEDALFDPESIESIEAALRRGTDKETPPIPLSPLATSEGREQRRIEWSEQLLELIDALVL